MPVSINWGVHVAGVLMMSALLIWGLHEGLFFIEAPIAELENPIDLRRPPSVTGWTRPCETFAAQLV